MGVRSIHMPRTGKQQAGRESETHTSRSTYRRHAPPHAEQKPRFLGGSIRSFVGRRTPCASHTTGDGHFDAFVGGYGAPNLVLKWNKEARQFHDIATPKLQDTAGRTLGASACDVDGDGYEEMYVLISGAYSGGTMTPDRLFDKPSVGKAAHTPPEAADAAGYVNLMASSKSGVAGRSAGCVDRLGTGIYGVVVSNYATGNTPSQARNGAEWRAF